VIRLAKNATYTLALAGRDEDASATGDLDVTGPLTVKGNGSTIDANRLDGVLKVHAGAGLKLANVTLTGGQDGMSSLPYGALSNGGTTTLSHVTVTGNQARQDGGSSVFNGYGASLTISDSTIADSLAYVGVDDAGSLVVRRSRFLRTSDGLHVQTRATATVSDTEFTDSFDHAVTNDGSAHVTRTTISGGTAGLANHGELWFSDGSISDNTFVATFA
jgi:hypothetical protein